MSRLFVIGVALLLAFLTPAEANMRVTEARYTAGILILRGEAPGPNQTVTLDNRYRSISNQSRQFRFRVQYRPRNCVATIRAGQKMRNAKVTNCRSARGQKSQKLRGKRSKWGLTRPKHFTKPGNHKDDATKPRKGEIWRRRPGR